MKNNIFKTNIFKQICFIFYIVAEIFARMEPSFFYFVKNCTSLRPVDKYKAYNRLKRTLDDNRVCKRFTTKDCDIKVTCYLRPYLYT